MLTLYKTLFKLIALQCCFTMVISLILFFTNSLNTALSFSLGGIICIIPSYLFGRIFLKKTGAEASHSILNAFYSGEAFKLLATALLFVLAFQWKNLQAAALFLGFMGAQFIYWIVLFRINF